MNVILRTYRESDLDELLMLFHSTVHTVCRGDYTEAQLAAWAPEEPDRTAWQESFLHSHTVVAELDGEIVGFANMEADGHFDKLYVHNAYLRQGIARLLADRLEEAAKARGIHTFTVEASITARPFFEKRGYQLVKKQEVQRRGQSLRNYVMRKQTE